MQPTKSGDGIDEISVYGFKSFENKGVIELKGLTILAGTNSSGKSSFMQPLMMMKQTLDAAFDPGPLMLHGDNAKIDSFDDSINNQLPKNNRRVIIGFRSGLNHTEITYTNPESAGLKISSMSVSQGEDNYTLKEGLNSGEIRSILPKHLSRLSETISNTIKDDVDWTIRRNRSFLSLSLVDKRTTFFVADPGEFFGRQVRDIIHVPGLRGNPERSYPVNAVGNSFPGTFEKYVASIIHKWKNNGDKDQLKALGGYLESLGLTWKVYTEQISDTQVKLKVGRLRHATQGGAYDLVNIADVGIGVSQVLPVVTALMVANPNQIVYIEQPEIHLHPYAQYMLGDAIRDAVNKGVSVVVETHSDMILSRIQYLVATDQINHNDVSLNWFELGDNGNSVIHKQDISDSGSYGTWPVNFNEVDLIAESNYISAAQAKLMGKGR